MNKLLNSMSIDMGIDQYRGEPEDSFIYRLCFSALGQWCLHSARNSSNGNIGITKHNQTNMLNELLLRYSKLFPTVASRFVDDNGSQSDFSVYIRKVYEKTGYFLTDKNNRNCLVNYGRCIPIGDTALFFGIPNKPYVVNGLGVFCEPTTYKVSSRNFLIRDDLTCEEYFQSQFDIVDFCNKDIDSDNLEFFNPLSNKSPSRSWERRMKTNCSVARKNEWGPFYRVMRTKDASMLFAYEEVPQSDSFTSYEFRRLYFSLKTHYNNPLKATIFKQDARYSKIKINGHLPHREYYYMLLLSWPVNNAFDKVNFLIKNSLIPEITAILTCIGIEVRKGEIYV